MLINGRCMDIKITLGTTYYENPEYLYRFIKLNKDKVDEIIIVDDYSTKFPAENLFDKEGNIQLYKVTKDYGFNSHGARNLIVNQAKNDWVCLIDVDREFHDEGRDLLNIYNHDLSTDVLYKFVCSVETFGKQRHKSVNDFLIHKDLFNMVGGYDEECIGYRTGDRQLFDQISNFAKIQTLSDVNLILTRPPTTLTQAKSYERIIPKNLKDLFEERQLFPNKNKDTLTFDWEKVF